MLSGPALDASKRGSMARPQNSNPGLGLLGAGLGAAVGRSPGAAVLGFLAGAALSSTPMPLRVALRHTFRQYGLEVLSIRQDTKLSMVVNFGDDQGRFWTLQASVPRPDPWDPEILQDQLYDAVTAELAKWRALHG